MAERKKKRGVLAEGEVTGHAHVIDADVTVLEDGVRAFRLSRPKPVTHEEHGAMLLRPDEYLADRVVEYDEDDEERRVMD